jgi:hypothetical protein
VQVDERVRAAQRRLPTVDGPAYLLVRAGEHDGGRADPVAAVQRRLAALRSRLTVAASARPPAAGPDEIVVELPAQPRPDASTWLGQPPDSTVLVDPAQTYPAPLLVPEWTPGGATLVSLSTTVAADPVPAPAGGLL